ncbi:LysR family transcriptional regulator [Brevundimonas naejangsanensis]|uniref:LysR family transcriptional regulator n=1 Tax=Brevundimonas naejangsanensis TaxID=588932 RepID=UPI000EC2B7F5|nr:LysR family transcriptional regulator [Brevundimonas naejangsanensis]HAC00937.1 LysR family transcriptional regulator [Brevundimonas sp.]HCW49482.1 LysR family transcriptional regulator [Brevundimonas sp.]
MGKHRRRINVRSFQVFEAIARLRSLTRAAEELGITQSAVSHQLRALAERLGEDLTERQGRTIRLTDAGNRLARSLGAAFDLIEEQVTVFEGERNIVRVGTYSSFAASWLIPRLPDFFAACPNVDLRVIMLYDPHEISIRLADIFITSEPLASGFSAKRLFSERLVPVVRVDGPEDFALPVRLISAEAEVGIAGRAWEAFASLNALDIAAIRSEDWLCCSHYILAQEMALCGMGAALLPDFMATRLIEDGRLRRLPGHALPTGQSLDIHVPTARRNETPIAAFSNWLRQAITEDEHMS